MARKPRLFSLGTRIFLGVVLGALTLIVVGDSIFALWPRGPLAGEWRHDFGDVLVPPGGATVRHTFVLTNRRGHALSIQHVIPSCGCVKAEPSSKSVEPGATVDVSVDFLLEGTGNKFVNIQLDLGDDGMKMLTVVANRVAK